MEEMKKISFKDFVVGGVPEGQDEYLAYRAQKRRRLGEETQKEGLFDRVGDKVAKAKRAIANGMPKHVAMAKYLVTSKDLGEETEVDEALNVSQRLARKRLFKRIQPKIKIGRERAKRRIASKEKLQNRSMKKAREFLRKKITKDVPKSELSFARRQEIEKRLESPAMKKRIKAIARKLFPKGRQAELAKKRGGSK